jgi:hypothetical protein
MPGPVIVGVVGRHPNGPIKSGMHDAHRTEVTTVPWDVAATVMMHRPVSQRSRGCQGNGGRLCCRSPPTK